MLTGTLRSRLAWSFTFISALVLVGVVSKIGQQPAPIYGAPSDYQITMDASTSPTTSETYVDFAYTFRYTDFDFFGVKAAPGNFLEMNDGGQFFNNQNSPITSVTGVTVLFSSSVATLYFAYSNSDFSDGNEVVVHSGDHLDFPSIIPYFLGFRAEGGSVIIESVIITYSCIPVA